MTTATAPLARSPLHPVHAVLLASTLPLALGALLTDWAYSTTHEVQWINFAAWLIVGLLLFAAAALLWSAVDFFRAGNRRHQRRTLYVAALLGTFSVGLADALIHARDAWATMPAGLILSALVLLLVLASIGLGFSTGRGGAGQ